MFKVLVMLSILSFATYAQEKTAAAAGNRGYGQAGCGLGAIVFGSQKGPVQILAATLNGTSGSQTFGMTSGTSNCKAAFGRDATDFIDANRMTLAKEMARGEGETLDSLATIYKCENTSAASKALKSNYQEIFSNPEKHSAAINESIINVLKKNSSAKCDILS